jgi:elongation factor P
VIRGKIRDRVDALASRRDAWLPRHLRSCPSRVNSASRVARFNGSTLERFSAPMPAANDLRRGMAIKYNGNPAIVLEVHHRTPGNLRAFVQAIIRYINTGKSADVRFGSTDKVELVDIERKPLEFSYQDRNGYHFMDPETYETITLQESFIGDAKDFLVENLSVQVLYAEGKPVQVELPASVNLKVIESPEGLRGDTASNVTKPATLETGKKINVPLFIKEGETIKIDTRTGAYMGRA